MNTYEQICGKGYHVKENAPVYFTKDMDRTAKWFENVLGWYSNIVERNDAGEGCYGVVFEITPEVELAHLCSFEIEYVHDIIEHSWGQRVIRFYDPDYHIIEVGEDMEMVVKRFKNSGMSDQQVADRMHVSLEYVRGYLNK